MFYVHLFLKAMYRKTTGKNKKQKLTLYFQNVPHMQVYTEQLKKIEAAESCCIKCRRG